MKRRHAAPPPLAAACAALLPLLLLAPPAPARAQGRGRATGPGQHKPPGPARDSPGTQPPSIRERQLIMDELARGAGKAPPPERVKLALAEIAEDYRRLQLVNNRMMSAVMSAPAPDYKLITEATGEIRRRSERLRDRLKLPEPEETAGERPAPKAAESAAQMKEALLALDRSIMSFVGSPLFRNTEVLDAAAAARASRDLAEVIERSRLAGKDAERLGKKPAAP
ncbi:MAG TPA: hypothetical protein VG148_12345 [Pyrinomonadaceae bacterium]|nr:hypothetical protein [Pyrinomonadaceae bacterium]